MSEEANNSNETADTEAVESPTDGPEIAADNDTTAESETAAEQSAVTANGGGSSDPVEDSTAVETGAGPESETDVDEAAPVGAAVAAAETEAESDSGPEETAADAGPRETPAEAPAPDAPVADVAVPDAQSTQAAGDDQPREPEKKKKKKTKAPGAPARAKKRKQSAVEQRFQKAMAENETLTGKVIGWNNGGFHVVIDKTTAFCPRSEMEIGPTEAPESYLDRQLEFAVLRVQDKGKRIVVSRSKLLRREAAQRRGELRDQLKEGLILDGTVDSLADFGAFVDLGGLRGLVHVSEISHQRVDKPSDVLEVGQQVQVKVLRIEQGGKRTSLSMKQLENNPWADVKRRYPEGEIVSGVVESSNPAGAVVALEPGISGFLPRKAMSLPMEAAVPRAFPPGKEVKVQVMSVDPRRQRLGLALEGKTLEGSRSDLKEFKRRNQDGGSFNALADALQKARGEQPSE